MGSYTNVEVIGEEYPVGFTRDIFSKLIFGLQIFIIIVIISHEKAKEYMPFVPQNVWSLIERKKWLLIILTFFLGNNIYSTLRRSGAFEIFINNELVFSKLQTGAVPTYQDLIRIIKSRGFRLV